MLDEHKNPTSYRELLIDVLSSQHESLGMKAPERSYWNHFDTDYLEELSLNYLGLWR